MNSPLADALKDIPAIFIMQAVARNGANSKERVSMTAGIDMALNARPMHTTQLQRLKNVISAQYVLVTTDADQQELERSLLAFCPSAVEFWRDIQNDLDASKRKADALEKDAQEKASHLNENA